MMSDPAGELPGLGTRSTRRRFLAGLASAGFTMGMTSCIHGEVAAEDKQGSARRPKPPYRVWFQPRMFERDIDLYQNMTIDASGWLDPRLAEAMGKTSLDWVYGLQHPWATGPEYWRDACSEKARSAGRFVSAGIAVDEWVPPKLKENPEWLAAGLRAGRRANPEVFIAVWVTDPTPPLIALAREGTIDLVIVEGYTHVAPDDPADWTTSWEGALRRCQTLADSDLTHKTILCFGHIAAGTQRQGQQLEKRWLRERAQELKQTYPTMPGVAFFQRGQDDSPPLRDLIRFCDGLSGELWPDSKP